MNANTFLERLDGLFAAQDHAAVEPFIEQELKEAYIREDYNVCVTILNEGIGYFRDTSQYEKSLGYCAKLLELFRILEMEGTVAHATSLLNVANALRASGKLESSLAFHQKVEEVYGEQLEQHDERFASLYNNMSLLYQEMGDFSSAVTCLSKALAIIEQTGDIIKLAITHSNLGSSLLNLGKLDEAKEHIHLALEIFHEDGDVDFHYGAALAAMAQAYAMEEDYAMARDYYYTALLEQYKHCGKTEFFYRLLDNLHVVEAAMGAGLTPEPTEEVLEEYLHKTVDDSKEKLEEQLVLGTEEAEALTGMQLAKAYFEASYPVFVDKCPEIVLYMAFGLIGEGSECLGFDDVYSTDHDFGPGFCIWLPHELYEQYGASVQKVYDALPDTYMGYSRTLVNGVHRVGVFDMDAFFTEFTGYASCDEFYEVVSGYPNLDPLAFLQECKEEGLSCLFHGEIFRDDAMMFTRRRDALCALFTQKYPEYFIMKISESLARLAQYGQYNYARAMMRADFVTAQIAIHRFVEECLKFAHYLNKEIPPYYKWLVKSTSKLERLPVLSNLVEAIIDHSDQRGVWNSYYETGDHLEETLAADKVVGIVEYIAMLIIYECKEVKLADFSSLSPEETYLDAYAACVAATCVAATCVAQTVCSKTELVDKIVSLEWSAFDQVQNEGGRADCQDDFSTFSIMRKSQYLTWTTDMIKSYILDFEDANARGWNLITEKYGRMMKSTDPHRYLELSTHFPLQSEKQVGLIEQVVAIQVRWMEEFTKQYPMMAGNSRSIHSYEDTLYNTSYETYLRGELGTYSDRTLKLYAGFIISLAKDEENLAKMTMEQTALLYGYESLEDAEEKLR